MKWRAVISYQDYHMCYAAFQVRVLVDGSVAEAFWDGGRAGFASRPLPPARAEQALGFAVSAQGAGGAPVAGVRADVDVYEMQNAWLAPVP